MFVTVKGRVHHFSTRDDKLSQDHAGNAMQSMKGITTGSNLVMVQGMCMFEQAVGLLTGLQDEVNEMNP